MLCHAGALSILRQRKLAVRVFVDIDETILVTYSIRKLLSKPIKDGDVSQFEPMLRAFLLWTTHYEEYTEYVRTTAEPIKPPPSWIPTATIDGM